MALRAVIDHPKFARLKTLIRANRSTALGYLECLWHFCGRYTPQGNIGKYSETEIEAWLEWDGEEGALIAAFVKARWLDLHPVHGYIVHDWHKHADDATRKALARAKLDFLTRPDDELAEETETTPVPTDLQTCPDCVPTVSGLPGAGAVSGAEPDLRESEGAPAQVLTVADGMAYWDRDSTSEPLRSVACCLCRAAEGFGAQPPAEEIVRKGARDGSAIRKVIDAVGWEEAADLHVWAVKHGKGDTFVPIWNNLAAYQELRKNGTKFVERRMPTMPTRKPSLEDANARLTREALDKMLARNEITQEMYDNALAAAA